MQKILDIRIAAMLLILAIALAGITQYAQAQHVVVSKTTVVKGKKVRALPNHHVVITHRNVAYRYADGVFYQPTSKGFVIVSAPAGIRVAQLPKHTTLVTIRGRRYYRYGDVYYKKVGRSYEVVQVA